MNERTHLDLFSGIGGFAIAAAANGVRTVQFCEIDERCRAFLAKAWPGVPIHDDIRSFHWNLGKPSKDGRETGPSLHAEHDGQRPGQGPESVGVANAGEGDGGRRAPQPQQGQEGRIASGWVGRQIWLLTAGVPCQPASRAGKQRGKEDDRWLWPEAIRVIASVKPAWALLENPPGIGDVGLSGILSEVEAEGYEVRVLSIPACAVGAPHRRERYWIMAHASERGQREHGRAQGQCGYADECDEGAVVLGNAEQARRMRETRCRLSGSRRASSIPERGFGRENWANFVWLPCADGKVRRAPDDSFGLVDGLHRSLLGALGNSIVPQVAAQIIAAMIEAEQFPADSIPHAARADHTDHAGGSGNRVLTQHVLVGHRRALSADTPMHSHNPLNRKAAGKPLP